MDRLIYHTVKPEKKAEEILKPKIIKRTPKKKQEAIPEEKSDCKLTPNQDPVNKLRPEDFPPVTGDPLTTKVCQRKFELGIDIQRSMDQLFKDLKKPNVIWTPHNYQYQSKKDSRYNKMTKIKTPKVKSSNSVVARMMSEPGYRYPGCSKHEKENQSHNDL